MKWLELFIDIILFRRSLKDEVRTLRLENADLRKRLTQRNTDYNNLYAEYVPIHSALTHYAHPEEHPDGDLLRMDADKWWWRDQRGSLARAVIELIKR